ncbi:MAG: type I-C CRISPR-associated protein Cas7/Csd2 [Armatimonadetes bacterium]|nr:type I-C CRISPR-associated protein Cas7/Csd2 [Armatimonadota bacterium]
MKLDQTMESRIAQMSDANRRYDFAFFVDIADGNPNGDPDYDNRPRLDEETGQGLISDVCIKRKIRDYIDTVHQEEEGNRIYVMNRDEFLEDVNDDLVSRCKSDSAFLAGYKQKYGDPFAKNKLRHNAIEQFACKSYFDWRCFGAVPGKSKSKSEDHKDMERATVRGPVQVQFGRSIDLIAYQEHAIGRVVQNKSSKEGGEEVHGTFGAKYTVRYAAYRFSGHYSAFLAKRTGFNDEDLKLFWESLICWPCIDSSAARPYMGVQGLYVFRHDSTFGNAPAHVLLDMVKLPPIGNSDARSWNDYKSRLILPDEGAVMPGVTFHRLVG